MREGLPGHRTGWNRRPRSGDGGNDFIAQGGAAGGRGKMVGPRRPLRGGPSRIMLGLQVSNPSPNSNSDIQNILKKPFSYRQEDMQ